MQHKVINVDNILYKRLYHQKTFYYSLMVNVGNVLSTHGLQ